MESIGASPSLKKMSNMNAHTAGSAARALRSRAINRRSCGLRTIRSIAARTSLFGMTLPPLRLAYHEDAVPPAPWAWTRSNVGTINAWPNRVKPTSTTTTGANRTAVIKVMLQILNGWLDLRLARHVRSPFCGSRRHNPDSQVRNQVNQRHHHKADSPGRFPLLVYPPLD